MNFRDLTAYEIECRVQSVRETPRGKGLILLLYKDARVDMNILDETVRAENWQREHYECKGNLFCRVGIRVGADISLSAESVNLTNPNWVWKSDCGTESNTEAQKGEASDSFKRACFNWGIGRELYTAPFIWINEAVCNIEEKKDRNGKIVLVCSDKFAVEKIIIDNKRITALSIWNMTKNCRAYVWQEKTQ